MTILISSRQKINAIFGSLSAIHDTYLKADSTNFLAEANEKSEHIWSIYLKFVIFGFVSVVISSTAASILIQWITMQTIQVKTLFHLFKLILPWDQSTLLGYFMEIIVGSLVSETYYLIIGTLFTLFVSICLLHHAFYRSFSHKLKQMDRLGDNREKQMHLCELVRFYISIKEWFLATANVYSQIILVQLLSITTMLACSTFQLELFIKTVDLALLVFVMRVTIGFVTLFLYCHYGQLATESFKNMADCLFECDWVDLPIATQKYILLMMVNAQRPVHYQGFCVIILNLRTFCKLTRTVLSYYFAFKTLTN